MTPNERKLLLRAEAAEALLEEQKGYIARLEEMIEDLQDERDGAQPKKQEAPKKSASDEWSIANGPTRISPEMAEMLRKYAEAYEKDFLINREPSRFSPPPQKQETPPYSDVKFTISYGASNEQFFLVIKKGQRNWSVTVDADGLIYERAMGGDERAIAFLSSRVRPMMERFCKELGYPRPSEAVVDLVAEHYFKLVKGKRYYD